MSTPFSTVYDKFIFKITSYKILNLPEDDREFILYNYLNSACAEYQTELKSNITDVDLENQCFNDDLTSIEIDILAEAMVVEWLKPIIYDDELLQNKLNTRDFTEYSTANLSQQIHEIYNQARKNVRLRVNEYTYKYTNLSELTKNHKVVFI